MLSEVPGAYTPEEWLQIRAAVEASGRRYMLAENLSFMDFIRYWRRWHLDGRFGARPVTEVFGYPPGRGWGLPPDVRDLS